MTVLGDALLTRAMVCTKRYKGKKICFAFRVYIIKRNKYTYLLLHCSAFFSSKVWCCKSPICSTTGFAGFVYTLFLELPFTETTGQLARANLARARTCNTVGAGDDLQQQGFALQSRALHHCKAVIDHSFAMMHCFAYKSWWHSLGGIATCPFGQLTLRATAPHLW